MGVRPGYKQTEVGVIPMDWEAQSLKNLNLDISDGNYSSKYPSASDFRPYGVPFIRANNVRNMGILDDEMRFISQSQHEELLKGHLKKNDVLITTRGEIGQIALVPDRHVDSNINAQLVRINTGNKGIDHRFFAYSLLSKASQEQLTNLQTGSALKQLPVGRLTHLQLALAPLPEQLAIARTLSDVDALLAALDRLIAKKRDLKQATMQQLLTGQTRLPGFQGEWEGKRLGDVATFHKGKGLPKSALSLYGAEHCIHYGELFTRYAENINEILSRTDTSGVTFRSVANDVLMPTSDVTPRGLAKASCVGTDGVILGGDILVIRSDTRLIFGSFLSYLIRYEEDQILQLVTGSTVFHLYGTDMKKFVFSMPPLPEQAAIARVLGEMEAELASLAQRRNKTRALKQAMMQELLTGRTRLV